MSARYSLLLVEDDPTLGPITAYGLGEYGHEVMHVCSVTSALNALCAENGFDAVLLDLNLGQERGESLIQRAQEAHCGIPEVILVSAQPRRELVKAMRATHACAVVQKPCTLQELNAALELCVGPAK